MPSKEKEEKDGATPCCRLTVASAAGPLILEPPPLSTKASRSPWRHMERSKLWQAAYCPGATPMK